MVAGFRQAYTPKDVVSGIPRQWRRLVPYMGSIQNQVGKISYGVVCSSDAVGNAEYMCGLEVMEFSGLPPEMDRLRIPEQTYAVFSHDGHISTLQNTWQSIWDDWYPDSGYEAANTPDFERYGEGYSQEAGIGGIEIWFPIKN